MILLSLIGWVIKQCSRYLEFILDRLNQLNEGLNKKKKYKLLFKIS